MKLRVLGPMFFSLSDEKLFFEWVSGLEAVTDISGEGKFLSIEIIDNAINDDFVRELLSIFRRYSIHLAYLKIFATEERRWLSDSRMIWHEEMFTREAEVDLERASSSF